MLHLANNPLHVYNTEFSILFMLHIITDVLLMRALYQADIFINSERVTYLYAQYMHEMYPELS